MPGFRCGEIGAWYLHKDVEVNGWGVIFRG